MALVLCPLGEEGTLGSKVDGPCEAQPLSTLESPWKLKHPRRVGWSACVRAHMSECACACVCVLECICVRAHVQGERGRERF